MSDPGLTQRLRQHTRRSGLMVGLSMALTMALVIGGFIAIFAFINPYLSDFISAEAGTDSTPTVAAREALLPATAPVAAVSTPDISAPTEPSESNEGAADSEIPGDELTPGNADEDETDNGGGDDFAPDFTSNPSVAVNFRSQPGVDGSSVVSVLQPSTPIQATGEEQTVSGVVWLEFELEDGTTGWIREIDTEVSED